MLGTYTPAKDLGPTGAWHLYPCVATWASSDGNYLVAINYALLGPKKNIDRKVRRGIGAMHLYPFEGSWWCRCHAPTAVHFNTCKCILCTFAREIDLRYPNLFEGCGVVLSPNSVLRYTNILKVCVCITRFKLI